ncbi:MAG: hypothetical protein ACLSE7_00950 [Lachnospirales bacterium]
MTDEEAISSFEAQLLDYYDIYDMPDFDAEAAGMAISALRDRIAREKPEPLTRKNLRSMNDQCVWVQYEELGMSALVAYHTDDEDGDGVYLTNNLGGRSEFAEVLAQGGIVYRTKPKEGTT